MKKVMMALALGGMVCACGQKQADSVNPFMTEFQTPYGTPDFNNIKLEHYEPAFLKGIDQQNLR